MTSLISQEHNIPDNATIRQEYITCGNPDCKELHKPHGPYLYAYWKENKKLRKKYVGKSWEDYEFKKYTVKECNGIAGKNLTATQLKKLSF
jgi:hypothetical protein